MKPMKWYWKVGGGHTHVRVFMNGAKCGDLCFRNEEFQFIMEEEMAVRKELNSLLPPNTPQQIEFVEEEKPTSVYDGMTETEKHKSHVLQVQQMMRDGA